MLSPNMNYLYNVEYFDGLESSGEGFGVSGMSMKERTRKIVEFPFEADTSLGALEKAKGIQSFELYTAYPGLMIGTGAMHDIDMEEALKNGFTFDYVTGLPYLPGSSLKGILRSFFPQKEKDEEKKEYIRSYLSNKETDIKAFMQWIFGDEKPGNINFIGAFPKIDGQAKRLLAMEYITPHASEFLNPIPISMLKIKPGVKFRFVFICKDYKDGDRVIVSAEEMTKLFKSIILDMGIGAKTNVGFGVMSEQMPKENKTCNSTGSGQAQSNIGNTSTSTTGDVITCKVCKRNYQRVFHGEIMTECPYCKNKKGKKSGGGKPVQKRR